MNSSRTQNLIRAIRRHRWFYLMMTPTFVYFLIFKYGPIWNAQLAFKDFKPLLGVVKSPWVGVEHFKTFINSFYFEQLILQRKVALER